MAQAQQQAPQQAPQKPPLVRVRATEKCFINNRLREANEEFDYRGPLGGPLVDARTPKPADPDEGRRVRAGGIPAPSWTTDGFKELNPPVNSDDRPIDDSDED